MTHPTHPTRSVLVSVDTVGRARLGHLPGPAPRSAPLYVAGGLVIVDPFAPDLPPYAEVDSAAGEGPWLPLLYGETTARALRAARSHAATVPVAGDDPADRVLAHRTAAWQPGPLHTPLARLAVLSWLARWAPVRLDPVLLDIEAGTLLAALTDVVPDAEDTARLLLSRRADELTAVATTLLDHGVLPGERWVAALLRDALHATVTLAEDLPHTPGLRTLADRADLAAGDDDAPDPMNAELQRLLEPVRVYEYAETVTDTDGWHTSNIDWIQVPPHTVATREGAIRWRLHDTDATPGIEVNVDAADHAGPSPAGDQLAFRVYAPDRPLPVAIGPLEHGTDHWHGTAPLREPVDYDRLHVDVYHPTWASPVRDGTAAELAAAERQAVRDLMALRTGLARNDTRTLRRWAEIVTDDTAPRLARLEQESGPDPLTNRVTSLARAAQHTAGENPQDPADPQLASPVWRPTLAEWSRLRPL